MLPAPPVDHAAVKLGKQPPALDPNHLQLLHYLTDAVKAPSHFNLRGLPKSAGIIPPVDGWGMLANDRTSDCTQAARLHMHEGWLSGHGVKRAYTDDDALADYAASCGYQPDDPQDTDRGGVEAVVLKWWRTAAPLDRRILAYAACEPRNIDHVKLAVSELGGCYLGIALPRTAQNQSIWAVIAGAGEAGMPGSWGGHAVNIVGYGPLGFRVVTWGYEQVMTYEFFKAYCDEAWAVISQDWLDKQGRDPHGLDLRGLLTDMKAVTR